MEIFRVIRPGSFTTVQDRGRFGFQKFGVPPAGALDDYALRVANLLVGNGENQAVLEMTIQGPRLEVLGPAAVAITGAQVDITLNGEAREGWMSFTVRPGDILNIGQVRRGCRAYLAVSGGIDVPPVMGSRSTYAAAALGGHQGRALARGDILPCGEGIIREETFIFPEDLRPPLLKEITLRAIPGPQDDFDEGLRTFFGSVYQVTGDANRMGYRLQGPTISRRPGAPPSIISEPSLPGGVQIPPDGNPIILLVEQTVGGYAKIATVISTDLSLLAQARPGDSLRFEEVSLEEAHRLYRAREHLLESWRCAK